MEVKLYFLLCTRSKRSILRVRHKRKKVVNYNPRIDLLNRLSEETGMTVKDVRNQLLKERDFLLKQTKLK